MAHFFCEPSYSLKKQRKKMKNQTNKKNRLSLEVFDNWLGVILNGFFLVFFCLYIGKYGITHMLKHGGIHLLKEKKMKKEHKDKTALWGVNH